MASYLLNATEAEMERWKQAAARKGLSFAAFIRTALEQELQREQERDRVLSIDMYK